MTPDYIDLYRTCFPEDGEKTVNMLFGGYLNNRVELRENGRLTSALYIVEKTLSYLGREVPLPYIVGLGTLPKMRNGGRAEKLLIKTFGLLKNYPFVALYPFKHSFYERFGFCAVSRDFEAPRGKFVACDYKTAEKVYRNATKNSDFKILRSKEYFARSEKLYAAENEGFRLSEEGGCLSPDGYIPPVIPSEGKEGVMVRIINLRKALELTGSNSGKIAVRDAFIPENNVVFILKNGEYKVLSSSESPDEAADISVLCGSCFGKNDLLFPRPVKNGFLADKY